jgi:hypothetical protein
MWGLSSTALEKQKGALQAKLALKIITEDKRAVTEGLLTT